MERSETKDALITVLGKDNPDSCSQYIGDSSFSMGIQVSKAKDGRAGTPANEIADTDTSHNS